MNACELLSGVAGRHQAGTAPLPTELDITDVITEPGKVSKNALYIAITTPMRDGHDGADSAYLKGCRLFLAERELTLPPDAAVLLVKDVEAWAGPLAAKCLGNPGRSLVVFGIAGSHGKSSVALLTAAVLRQNGRRVGVVTTDGVDDGSEERPAGVTLPDAVEIQHILARFCQMGCEFAVLEFSAYQLQHRAAHGIPFDALLLTDATPAHIGRGEFCREGDYFEALHKLFDEPAPLTLLPDVDLPFGVQGHTVHFGRFGAVGCQALEPMPYACRFRLAYDGEAYEITHPVPGDFAMYNATASAALALAADLPLSTIAASLSALTVPFRMERVAPQIFLDTAYTGEDVKRALTMLRRDTPGRLSVLTGTVGGRARQRRAALGAACTAFADFSWFTTDDADAESPDALFRDLTAGIGESCRYRCVADRKEALLAAVAALRPGDALLVTGRGGQTWQLIAGERVPFSDREFIKEVLS